MRRYQGTRGVQMLGDVQLMLSDPTNAAEGIPAPALTADIPDLISHIRWRPG